MTLVAANILSALLLSIKIYEMSSFPEKAVLEDSTIEFAYFLIPISFLCPFSIFFRNLATFLLGLYGSLKAGMVPKSSDL